MIYNKHFSEYLEFDKKLLKDYEDKHCIENIGWSLGNACPYKCKHCYSHMIRSSKSLTKDEIDIIVEQINKLPVKTVNLGGNEPWFTNGLKGESLLPYIIEKLYKNNYKIGITTSGITIINLKKFAPETLQYINDVDISIDHYIEKLHNDNRGADVYKLGLEALKIVKEEKIDRSIIMCAMKWNFTIDNLKGMLELCKKYDANIRFNVLKPLEKYHMDLCLSAQQFYDGYQFLLNYCDTIDITEPRLSAITKKAKTVNCPCGTSSLRIHSITEEGVVYVSPCIYLHDFKVGDLLKDDILDIVNSQPFKEMRKRNYLKKNIKGCEQCEWQEFCGGGCAAQAYLVEYWKTGRRTLNVKEIDCLKEQNKEIHLDNFNLLKNEDKNLVHQNYLCTWIGRVKNNER